MTWNKVIEFEEGKNAINLASKAELEPTLQNIKKAIDEAKVFSENTLIKVQSL